MNRVYFGCGNGTGISEVNFAPNCAGTGGTFTVHLIFPTSLDPQTNAAAFEPVPGRLHDDPAPAHRADHVSDPGCPGGHARVRTLYTFHADFYNSWNQEALRRLLHGWRSNAVPVGRR